jgi:hypothetical protein
MKTLTIGERVRVTAGIPSFWRHAGRIVQIVEPFVGESILPSRIAALPGPARRRKKLSLPRP